MSDANTSESPKEYLGREKPCIQYVPMKQMLPVAEVFRLGAQKYGQKNWRLQPVRMSTYYNAMYRHMVDWFEANENLDPESKQHPLHHVIACALIILDGIDRSSITDDRSYAEVKTGKLSGTKNDGQGNTPQDFDKFLADKIAAGKRAAAELAAHAAVDSALKKLPDAATRLDGIEEQFRREN